VFTERGTRMHDLMCDAALEHGGYIVIDGSWYEVLYATRVTHPVDSFKWRVRLMPIAGAA
jgi:hypothetical protein